MENLSALLQQVATEHSRQNYYKCGVMIQLPSLFIVGNECDWEHVGVRKSEEIKMYPRSTGQILKMHMLSPRDHNGRSGNTWINEKYG